MKTVFTNNELAHVWIKETQNEGRGSSFYFRGAVIYSYGDHFPIAQIYHNKRGKVVLMTEKKYSVTTAKHISLTRRAIDCDYVPALNVMVDDTKFSTKQLHHDNLNYALKKIETLVLKSTRARSNAAYYLNTAMDAARDYQKYIDYFKPSLLSIHKKAYDALITDLYFTQELKDKIRAAAALEVKRQEARHATAIENEKEALLLWRAGGALNRSFQYTALRIKDDHVETSRGARVPIDQARILASMIKDKKDVLDFEIDGFKIVSYAGGILKIGCHEITQNEIDALLPSLV